MTRCAEPGVADTATRPAASPNKPPLHSATRLAQAWRCRVSHTAALAGAEAELAARSVPAIVVLLLLAGGLALSAWLTFFFGVAWLALGMGVPLAAVAGAAIMLHAVLAFAALRRAERLSANLSLPRLRASLSASASAPARASGA